MSVDIPGSQLTTFL